MPTLAQARDQAGGRDRRPCRLLATLGGLALLAASTLLIGTTSATAQPSEQPAPSGSIIFAPASGGENQTFAGTTAGPCNVPGPDGDQGMDGYDAVVLGPGVFASDPADGKPDGIPWVAPTEIPVNGTTEPVAFAQRQSFLGLAQEEGGELLAGTYEVTFRCRSLFYSTIFQTYRSSFTITKAADGTYTIAAANAATPTPSGTAGPTGTPTATPTVTPTTSGSVSPSPSGSGSPSPSGSVSPSPSGSPRAATPTPATTLQPNPTPTPSGSTGSGSGGSLAFTGAPLAMLVVVGTVLSGAGAALIAARRNRRRGGG